MLSCRPLILLSGAVVLPLKLEGHLAAIDDPAGHPCCDAPTVGGLTCITIFSQDRRPLVAIDLLLPDESAKMSWIGPPNS